jgi:hypothetical protein
MEQFIHLTRPDFVSKKARPPLLTLLHSRSTNTLSIQRPLPSMLTRTPLASSTAVNSSAVNCEPWSVLKISGVP